MRHRFGKVALRLLLTLMNSKSQRYRPMLAHPSLRTPSPMLAFQWYRGQLLLKGDRRDHDSRDRLLRRIREEFREMPCLRLTDKQASRLFGLSKPVCERVLGTLVSGGTLWKGADGRYAVRARQ